MSFKKLILIFLIIAVFSLSLSACKFFTGSVYLRDDNKIGETRFQEIIEALQNKDKERLKSMFSSNALKEANDIDGGIEYLMEFYKGKIISKEVAREGSDSKNYGERNIELKSFYMITTDVDEYIVFFIDQLVDTKNPDNVGLYMLQIIKQSDRDKEFDWGNKIKCAGIYLPTVIENK